MFFTFYAMCLETIFFYFFHIAAEQLCDCVPKVLILLKFDQQMSAQCSVPSSYMASVAKDGVYQKTFLIFWTTFLLNILAILTPRVRLSFCCCCVTEKSPSNAKAHQSWVTRPEQCSVSTRRAQRSKSRRPEDF